MFCSWLEYTTKVKDHPYGMITQLGMRIPANEIANRLGGHISPISMVHDS